MAGNGASPALAVETGGAGRDAAFAVDLASGAVEPPTGNLVYVPAVRGEQAWLPNLVSRVRELPFVGPEKIAFLENAFFTLVDQVTQAVHRLTGPGPAAPPEMASGNRGGTVAGVGEAIAGAGQGDRSHRGVARPCDNRYTCCAGNASAIRRK